VTANLAPFAKQNLSATLIASARTAQPEIESSALRAIHRYRRSATDPLTKDEPAAWQRTSPSCRDYWSLLEGPVLTQAWPLRSTSARRSCSSALARNARHRMPK